MSIFLGNIRFNQIEEKLGFRLDEEDRELWDKFHCSKADLSSKESCFHVFDIPRCIQFKGEEAKQAILKMFTPEKLVNPICVVNVYEMETP